MARRRYQHGSVFERGKRDKVWVGRWREDVINPDGTVRRVEKKEVLGTKKEFPTKKLAIREMESRLTPINSVNYRALRASTFADFAQLWEKNALSQHKPSTQSAIKSQLKKWLVRYFGGKAMREIGCNEIQDFIRWNTLGPKSCRNMVLTLRMMWKSAQAWGYVTHEPFTGLVYPKVGRQARLFFTMDEIQRILAAAPGPLKTFYWLAAETGMRSGELCGLRIEDMDLENCLIHVKQTVWGGKVQVSPKTDNAIRSFAISSRLRDHLVEYVATWRPNLHNFVFATKNGTPWDRNLVVKRKLHPLLDKLKIARCGMHAFRHTNGSLMDRLQTPMKVRQERLGHAAGSNITMVVYTHTVSADDRKVAEELGAILRPGCGQTAQEKAFASGEGQMVQ